MGLKCIINQNQYGLMKKAIKDIAEEILLHKSTNKNKKINVSIKEVYDYMKENKLDVDIESIASIYGDVFKDDIESNSVNYDSQEKVDSYENAVKPLSKKVKEVLINAGFSKVTNDGEIILDWTKIMYPLSKANNEKSGDTITTEEQKKSVQDAITKYVKEEVNKDEAINSDKDKVNAEITERVKQINAQLENEWAQILSNAIAKKVNILNSSNKKPQVSSGSSAIKRMGKMVAVGLTESDDSYNEAMRKVLGISDTTQGVLKELDVLGRSMFNLANSKYGENNEIGVDLEKQANALLAKARWVEGGAFYKIAMTFKGLVDMANLGILNNPANRGENRLSSEKELKYVQAIYGKTPEEIKKLGQAIKKDISRRGGADFGGVTNILFGDRNTSEVVREHIANLFNTPYQQRAFNRFFNFIFGTTALNGNDSATKAQLTWVKFIAGMEDILLSKENKKSELDPNYKPKTKEAIRKELNEKLFGKNWDKYLADAEVFMNKLNEDGKVIEVNKQTIYRFAADIARAELVQGSEIDLNMDEVDSAYRAGFTSAGRGIGHVPNNLATNVLSYAKRSTAELINKAVKKKEYNKAGGLILLDAIVNRSVFRMIGGGMNWGVLKLQSGGLGIVGGLIGKAMNKNSFENKKRLSELSYREIEETISETQKINDRFNRGAFGAVLNTALLFAVVGILKASGGDDEEDWKKYTKWLGEHRFGNRYLNKFLPLFLAVYLNHKLQLAQPNGYGQMNNAYRYNPALQQYKSLIMYRDNTSVDKIYKDVINLAFTKDPKREKELELYGKASESISGLLNLNPLPYKAIVDMVDIGRTTMGEGFDYTDDYKKDKDVFSAIVDGTFEMKENLNRKKAKK